MAHRDDDGTGPGANNNASGIAALIQIARSYGSPVGSRAVSPTHTLVFVATDGGAFGALGARRFVEQHRGRVVAAIDLAALAGSGAPRLVLAGTEPRLASPGLVETAAQRVLEQAGTRPAHPGALGQLIDLAFPFTLHEQGPLLAHGVPALTLTSGGERPPSAFADQPSRLDAVRLTQLGRAAQQLLRWFDSGAELVPGTASYVYFGPRVLPGWAIELVLIAALAPIPSRGRRSVRTLPAAAHPAHPGAPELPQPARVLALGRGGVRAFRAARVLAERAGRPAAAGCRSGDALAGDRRSLGFAVLSGLGWLVARRTAHAARGRSRPTEELAGTTAALLALAVVALLVVATNPFALIFLLPSLHAWLWLPHVRGRPLWARAALLAAGFLGPLLLLGSFALRYDLGLDAPWYLAELTATGYVKLPALVIAVGWLASAGQMAALAAGRYAPYPSAAERPPRGPLRETVRRVVLTVRARGRAHPRPSGRRWKGEHETAVENRRNAILAVAGVGMLVWVLVVWRWQDPFTALYTHWKQHQLSQAYDRRFAALPAAPQLRRERRSRISVDDRSADRAGGAALPARLEARARRSAGSASRASA